MPAMRMLLNSVKAKWPPLVTSTESANSRMTGWSGSSPHGAARTMSRVGRIGMRKEQHMDVPLIELSGVVKSFGPVSVLKGVGLKAYPGKVTALVGDNGAGKSTLIKGLAGVQPYDDGEVRFDGKPVALHNPREASRLGIEVVYQDLALCDNLDIVQNMFLGREQTAWGT